MKEKAQYREQLALLCQKHPNKVALNLDEAAAALGVDRRTVKAMIEKKKLQASNVSIGKKYTRYIIPITAVARMSAG